MADDNFIGEIILTPFNFAPRSFALCNGQLLPISQNAAMFSLLGTTYGGDGITTFALPDLRGRVGISSGQGPGLSNYNLGDLGGLEGVTLNVNELPSHNHTANAVNSSGTTATPSNTAVWAASSKADGIYQKAALDTEMFALGDTGGNQPHENRPPILTLNYCIALIGIFPSRS
jgi:microcystin-dependent protein